jgi:hypothetical protein
MDTPSRSSASPREGVQGGRAAEGFSAHALNAVTKKHLGEIKSARLGTRLSSRVGRLQDAIDTQRCVFCYFNKNSLREFIFGFEFAGWMCGNPAE